MSGGDNYLEKIMTGAFTTFERRAEPKLYCLAILTLLLSVVSHAVIAAEAFDAFINKVDIPDKMIAGKTYTAKVSVKNIGSAMWTSTSGISLALTQESNKDWNISAIALDSNDRIKPGEFKSFVFPITATTNTGVYTMQFVIAKNGKPIGPESLATNVVVETRTNRVGFISQLMPNTMNAGQKYSIVVQFKNEGTVNWTRKGGYQIGLKSKSKTWNVKRVRLNENDIIAPGTIATFRFDLVAPDEPGIHNIQWQMQRWNDWFGEPAPMQQITVVESGSNTGAEFVYQDIEGLKQGNQLFAIVKRGDIIPVNITFKNTSDEAWTEGHYSLNSQNPPNNLTWSVDRIDLKPNEVIKPGQIKAFNFKIMAPLEPGIYHFQWQMVKGFNTWIGEKTEDIVVTVK